MHSPAILTLLLPLALPALCAPPAHLHERSPDFTGDAPATLPACGVSLFIGDNGGGNSHCVIATSTERSGAGQVNLWESYTCSPANPGPLIAENTPNIAWGQGSAGKFSISQTADSCGTDGRGCYPTLE